MVTRFLLLLCLAWGSVVWADVGRVDSAPRGVHPDLVSMYTADTREFQCLDGSLRIPFAQVNDDYCDCEVSEPRTLLILVVVMTLVLCFFLFRTGLTSPAPPPARAVASTAPMRTTRPKLCSVLASTMAFATVATGATSGRLLPLWVAATRPLAPIRASRWAPRPGKRPSDGRPSKKRGSRRRSSS